ncbi:DUF5336 domain-containing protein [Mycobacterium sp. 236(2023)]|uniref:DUF5336 domain-containing protein n=1 Tax=Mycobacterium sp. 236(2023) TaxID=3038163 RepID=UPI002414D3F7|nr:DUF5336 domain-containing protein [Mycobacterium sp. 236(2023)]MDG4665835.1 DUF5336 domain-containing protein [Mycobacterium sp. 236(2023)]
MSYPQGAPGGQGFPPGQQPTTQFAAPTQQFNKVPDVEPGVQEPSKLPAYLSGATAALGLLVFLSSFGPQFAVGSADIAAAAALGGISLWGLLVVVSALLSALFAGVGLLPKQQNYSAFAAVAAVLSFLLVIYIVLSTPSGVSLDWGLYLVILFSLLQAAVAVVVLLFDAGIITPPVAKPKYEQPQYGQYPGAYYGQPPAGPAHQQAPLPRPGYPTPYGAYPSTGPTTGGFPAAPQSGSPTPPTGFPSFGQPPASNAPTTQVPTQHQSPSTSEPGQSS